MLAIDKIKFTEGPDPFRPGVTRISGQLSMHCVMYVHDGEHVPRDHLHDQISREFWHNAYGDLFKPIEELFRCCTTLNLSPDDRLRLAGFIDKLDELLMCKKMEEFNRATRKEPNT